MMHSKPRNRLRHVIAAMLVAGMAVLPERPSLAAEAFPVGEELLLDARPMRGAKRIPMLDIRRNGVVMIDLWCNSVQAQFIVADETLTVLIGPKTQNSCSPEREQADAQMLSVLEQVTNWRREDDGVTLIGPQNLRFRKATN